MTAAHRSESELTQLRKVAGELAASRKERPTTVHLLAAVAGRPGPASDLLAERGLDKDSCLKAGRTFDEQIDDALGQALLAARDVSKRVRGPVSTDGSDRQRPSISPDSRLTLLEPAALHLLVALLAERRFAAYRALTQSGIDTTRLRTAALSRALGVVAPRREARVVVSQVAATPTTAGARVAPRPSALPPTFVAPMRPPGSQRAARSPEDGAASTLGSRALPLRPSVVPLTPSSDAQERPRHGRRPLPSARKAGHTAPPDHAAPPKAEPTVVTEPPPSSRRGLRAPEANDAALTPLLSKLIERARSTAPRHPLVRREDEVEHVCDVLRKHRGNAPCLIGPPGVGKTSVALALAAQLARGGQLLVNVPLGVLFAGTGARGSLAERVSTLFEEARSTKGRVVLFVDDLADLLGAADEVGSELKRELAVADVGFVSTMNADAYRRLVEIDAQLARALVAIEIEEPAEEDAFFMIKSAISDLSAHHKVEISDEAIASAVSWTIRYMPGRALPDKAIGVIDLAAARARRSGDSKIVLKGAPCLSRQEVASALSDLTEVPVSRLMESDRERMLALEKQLAERVVGHGAELSRVASQLRKSAAGLRGKRPLGSFLLLGPTGVGKTETAKALAEALFGSDSAMTRIDMSEYAEAHAVARLIGAPPGYVGHEAGGQLTEAVKKRAYQVVLLDEIEKAHPDVMLAFLQVLDEGHLTDGRGRRVDFKNTVIVCTSNLGSRDVAAAMRQKSVGFGMARGPSTEDLSSTAISAAKKQLPLELFNRFDDVLFFAPLTRAEVRAVARMMLAELGATLSQQGLKLDAGDAVIEHLLDSGGFDPELGARPMRRTVARLVEGPLAEVLLRGELEPGAVILLGLEDGEIVVDSLPPGASRVAS